MANATAITVTSLTPDSAGIVQPTADVLDTGTDAVTLAASVGGLSELVILEVKNTAGAANNLTVTDLQAAYDMDIKWRGVFISPNQLTDKAIALKAQKQSTHKTDEDKPYYGKGVQHAL